MFVSAWVCVFKCVCVCVYVSECVYVFVHVCMRVHAYMIASVCMCTHACAVCEFYIGLTLEPELVTNVSVPDEDISSSALIVDWIEVE